MKHKFTTQECSKGGKHSAIVQSTFRRFNPTPLEKLTREAISMLHPDLLQFEYAVNTAINVVQYLDIYFEIDKLQYAIECDGSHDWHNSDYLSSKMITYDEMKAKYCNNHNIKLIYVTYHWLDHSAIELSIWIARELTLAIPISKEIT